jgi:hypothetical protein
LASCEHVHDASLDRPSAEILAALVELRFATADCELANDDTMNERDLSSARPFSRDAALLGEIPTGARGGRCDASEVTLRTLPAAPHRSRDTSGAA